MFHFGLSPAQDYLLAVLLDTNNGCMRPIAQRTGKGLPARISPLFLKMRISADPEISNESAVSEKISFCAVIATPSVGLEQGREIVCNSFSNDHVSSNCTDKV
ncbi:hypothetical protein HQ571_02040 [Candidatus Kuenenbacteria bacterium]|nr:hypothetical protein [Candidatus Kuenenbacteria bacterium]